MKRLAITVVVNAVAVWVATLVVPGVSLGVQRFGEQVGALLLVGALFGVVNAVVKPVVKLLSLPLYLLTLGLFTFVVNALMLQITEWLCQALGLAFRIDEFFWDAVLAAVVTTLVSVVLAAALDDD